MSSDREKTFDYYIILTERFPLPMGSIEGHKHEDFTKFIIDDFSKYDMQGEVLMDGEFKEIRETTEMELPIIRTQTYSRWICQEYAPEKHIQDPEAASADSTKEPYGEDFEFWKISDVNKYSMHDMFR